MVIKFSKIPAKVRVKIAEKMDYWSLKEFESACALAYKVKQLVDQAPALQISELMVGDTDITLEIINPITKQAMIRKWKDIHKIPSLPRFEVKEIRVFEDFALDNLNKWCLEVALVNGRTKVTWEPQDENAEEIFNRISEIFKVVEFEAYPHNDNPELIYLPQFSEMESVKTPVREVPDNIFLKMKAKVIHMTSLQSRPAIGYTLNRYFKQWFAKKREIRSFSVWMDRIGPEHPSLKPRVLFSGLPFTLLWSKETHASSIISVVPMDQVNPMFHDERIYLITRGGKKLLVIVDRQRVFAGEVENAKEAVRGRICVPEAQGIDLGPDDDYGDDVESSDTTSRLSCSIS